MESNEVVREQIFEVIKNQIRDNDPLETKQTFERLLKKGISASDANKLIGQCVAVEIYEAFTSNKPFDEIRYVENLKQLPKTPIE